MLYVVEATFGELVFRNSLQFLTIEKKKGICDEFFFSPKYVLQSRENLSQ
jgi:hypothetical protein